jgi:hypothetical protein
VTFIGNFLMAIDQATMDRFVGFFFWRDTIGIRCRPLQMGGAIDEQREPSGYFKDETSGRGFGDMISKIIVQTPVPESDASANRAHSKQKRMKTQLHVETIREPVLDAQRFKRGS